ncbi:DUF1656 domain-containing protein [Bradyrhizobium sp. HKCCYLRH3099]|uniref:DUF1656 domain-containing protein n=1 Tax=unclassified Bradyrhizobium TaxID=2631580 RepID=UPI003EBD2F2F
MYREINLFGVYFAPFVGMLLLAWVATLPLSFLGARLRMNRLVWHPGLFNLSIYVIVLSAIVVVSGALR